MRFRRKPEPVKVSIEQALINAMAAYLYQEYGRCPLRERYDAKWHMAPHWLDVIDDLLGDPLPLLPGGTRCILGHPVVPTFGRPRLFGGSE